MVFRNFGKILQVSLTIFAMMFGAGNFIFPLKLGLVSGDKLFWGFSGFALTGIFLPMLGLVTIVGFAGDYKNFFHRVGRVFGDFLIFFCMMVLGPFIIIPRLITVSYEMMQPFLFNMHVSVFSFVFLVLVFFASYRPRKLLYLIGKVLSPLKITSLLIIIVTGVITGVATFSVETLKFDIFSSGVIYGYGTLDLLATIFFASIIIKMLTAEAKDIDAKERIRIASLSSVFGGILLGLVYAGMTFLGAFHGKGFEALNEGQLFSSISFRIMGNYGAALIGFTIFLACFTTVISLCAVVADYVYVTLARRKIDYKSSLIAILVVSLFFASLGLSNILSFSMPVIKAMYPVLIVLTVCNALYKAFGFAMVKLPVYLTFLYFILLPVFFILQTFVVCRPCFWEGISRIFN